MNKRGFVLAETLTVVIFSILIFTLLYTSVVPLLAKYEELSYHDNIDTTYDLYQYKILLENDNNYNTIKNNNYKKLVCSDFSDSERCNTLNDVLNFTSSDTLLYFKGNNDSISSIKNNSEIDDDVKNYLDYIELEENENYLLMEHDSYLSYLKLYVSN
ncbi:MAG: hypothetical protein IKN63_05370 [Bacilli bacterium]|nr:hypothetical protein [Bacilli bacterium]